MAASSTLTRWAMRAGDLKTIHWSTAMVSWSPSFWMVMSPPKNSSENGDTSVQSYKKIWRETQRLLARSNENMTTDQHILGQAATSWHIVSDSYSVVWAESVPLVRRGWCASLKCVLVPLVLEEMSSCPICECVTLSHPFPMLYWQLLMESSLPRLTQHENGSSD